MSGRTRPGAGASGAIASTFSAKLAGDIIRRAEELGADGRELRDILGLEQGELSREDVRIPCHTMAAMWLRAMERSGDPLIALHLAEAQKLAADRTTALIMESSATVMEAFQLATKYSALIADVMSVAIGEEESTVYIEFTHKPDWRLAPEAVILDCLSIAYLSAVQSVQRLTGISQPPTLLAIALPKPAAVREYYRLFDCSVGFDAPAQPRRLSLGRRANRAVRTSDAGLKAVLLRYADELTARFRDADGVKGQVMREIYGRMSPLPLPRCRSSPGPWS